MSTSITFCKFGISDNCVCIGDKAEGGLDVDADIDADVDVEVDVDAG